MKHKQPLRAILLAARTAKRGMWTHRAGGVSGVKEVHILQLLRHIWFTFAKHFF